MSKRTTNRARQALDDRLTAFTRMSVDRRKGYHQPGSLNPHKSPMPACRKLRARAR